MQKYQNYHKHTHFSNIFTPDTHVKTIDYIKRIKELGYGCYFTTEHGSGGDVFEALNLCHENDIRCIYAIEAYIVPDAYEKDNSNYHIVIIPKTNKSRKKVNRITSRSNIEGFYYKPRIFMEDLLSLDKDDVFITSACVAGLLKDNTAVEKILLPLIDHFKDNIFLEVQNHNNDTQKLINSRAIQLSEQYGLKLIAANDSHYIYPEQKNDRKDFLKGKGIDYGEEDEYMLDFPDYDTLYDRFVEQGVLSSFQIAEAIENTNIFESCEDIAIDKNIKMPSIFPELSDDEKLVELRSHIDSKFKVICEEENITGELLKTYSDGIDEEFKVIEDTKEINTADYFLLNEKIVDLAVNKYGGVLTRSGRGSCGAYFINRILGMTQLDRFKLDVKLYPERFMSTARLLEQRSLPDIDYNVVSQEPFVNAAKELLGEHGCYPMIAYGTMQMGEAFRNVCRTNEIPFEEFNEVAKNIEKYQDDSKWKPYYEESSKYVDTIVSASPHPCAFILDNKDLLEEYGVVKIGGALCVMITSGEADDYKALKDDFLIVTVYKLIDETFKMIGKPIMTVNELLDNLDDKTWSMFENGLTCTLNQADGDWATSLLRQYKPKNVAELASFTACLRPFFNSWRDDFISRKKFSTGSKHLDEVLSSTQSYILYQESLMQYFEWLGITPAESIGLIKKISKKKIKQSDFDKLEQRLKAKWIENTGSDSDFEETWNLVQSCMSYGFAAPHAVAVAIDCLYGAYLKSHYPIEYYTVALNNYTDDEERTHKLCEELKFWGIKLSSAKYGHSKASYFMDKDTNTIHKGVGSIKYLNDAVGDGLYEFSKTHHHDSFIDFLLDLKESDIVVNSRQMEILIRLDYFDCFGNSRELYRLFEIYNFTKSGEIKSISKEKVTPELLEIAGDYLNGYNKDGKPSKKYKVEDPISLLKCMEKYTINNHLEDYNFRTKIAFQQEYLGYVDFKTGKEEDRRKLYVKKVTPISSNKTHRIWVYIISTVSIGSGKQSELSVWSNTFKNNPIYENTIIFADSVSKNDRGYWYLNNYRTIDWIAAVKKM